MKHRILVIGASIYQVPLIQRAKQLGLEVFSTSYLNDDPGLKIADKGFNISILDRPGLVKLCRKENITAVVTAASDLGSLTTGYLNDYLGFTGLTEQQVRSVTDKGLFIQLQEKLDLPRPQSFLLTSSEEFEKALPTIEKWPIIFKPIFASGSRGVQIIQDPFQAKEAFQLASETSELKQHCVLQTYLDGKEHGGECLIESGKVVFLEFTHKFSNNKHVPIGHCVPCSINESIKNALIQQIEAIVTHLGVVNSAINIDVIIGHDNIPILIDFSFRLGGNLLTNLMSQKYGLDPFERIIEYALTNEIKPIQTLQENQGVFGSIILGSPADSVLTKAWCSEIEKVTKENSTLIELIYDKKIGEKIEQFNQSSNRMGHILVTIDSLNIYQNLLEKIQNLELLHAQGRS